MKYSYFYKLDLLVCNRGSLAKPPSLFKNLDFECKSFAWIISMVPLTRIFLLYWFLSHSCKEFLISGGAALMMVFGLINTSKSKSDKSDAIIVLLGVSKLSLSQLLCLKSFSCFKYLY